MILKRVESVWARGSLCVLYWSAYVLSLAIETEPYLEYAFINKCVFCSWLRVSRYCETSGTLKQIY